MDEPKTSLEVIAPTVEEAIHQGAAELGIPESDLLVEVLDEGTRGVLGVGSRQARVRLSAMSRASTAQRPSPVRGTHESARGTGQLAGESATEAAGPALETAREIAERLLGHMGLTAEVEARWGEPHEPGQDPPIWLDVRGKDLSLLIGRRGETLRSFQYLTRLILTKTLGESPVLVVDVEGYRARREEQLRRLARKMADQALETGRTMTLEPMPAHERRIIHLELRDHARVYTESVGEGDHRKVTIILRT